MDVLIRNINPVAVKKIDELAKANKHSRSEYLRSLLENHASELQPSQREIQTQKQLEANTLFLEKTNRSLEDLVSILNDLLESGD